MITDITKMLGIEYPILLGGLQWISSASFVASIANEGGTGFLPAASFPTKEQLIDEIKKAKSLTNKPFGVNISMLPEASTSEKSNEYLEAVISENIPFVETSGRIPSNLVGPLKEANIKIIHKVTTPKHAQKAEQIGVDAVVLVGYEGGGHPGMDQVGTFVNLPKTVNVLNIPVIAAGGICDGKSMAAALALGAKGVMMGTRFVATKECPIHQNIKERILNSDITDTMIIQRSIKNAMRAITNEQAYKVLGLEQSGAGLAELLPYISGKKGLEALKNGDTNSAVLTAGQCIGRIDEIISVSKLIKNMVYEAKETINSLNKLI